jgi:aquaglyceroporin related protein
LEYVSDANAFFQEFVDSTVLLMVVLAISDSNNASPPDGLNPLVLFLLITGIGAALGMQTAYCINPARDLGPRLVTWFAGYGRYVHVIHQSFTMADYDFFELFQRSMEFPVSACFNSL